jgi:predicted alpha/beta-fold hydrolase
MAVWLLRCLGLRPPVVTYRRELFVLKDGATVGLDWASLSSNQSNGSSGVVLIHHGLAGSSQSEYIVFQVFKLLKADYDVIVMNARGCGGVPLTSPESFAGDRSKDIAEVVEHLRSRQEVKDRAIYLIGYSLGAATSLRYLGTVADQCPVSAAACISPPWNLEVVTDVFYLWSCLLAAALKSYIVYNREGLKHGNKSDVTLGQILACHDLHELDNLLVRSYGYATVEEYRRAVSPAYVAQTITVPTLAISASDDPVCAINGIPHPSQRGCGLAIIRTKYGGHLGFPVNGLFPTSWVEDVVIDWFLHHTNKQSQRSKIN